MSHGLTPDLRQRLTDMHARIPEEARPQTREFADLLRLDLPDIDDATIARVTFALGSWFSYLADTCGSTPEVDQFIGQIGAVAAEVASSDCDPGALPGAGGRS